MQKKYADFKLGVPDYVTVETEEERLVCQGGQTTVAAGATTVEFQDAGEHEDIFVTSEDAVRCVKLRWNYKIPKSARFLGDAWERTYGDAEWHGMSGNRYLPWYFLAKLSEKVLCFGVKVRPSAMCCWQVDTKGITLFLDVRCGNTGVQLKGRKLCTAQIVCMESEGADTFETAQEFCKKMCTDPIFPEFPVKLSRQFHGLGFKLFRVPVMVRFRRQVVYGRWGNVKPCIMLFFSLDFRIHPKAFKRGVPRLQGFGGKLRLRYFGKQMFRT